MDAPHCTRLDKEHVERVPNSCGNLGPLCGSAEAANGQGIHDPFEVLRTLTLLLARSSQR